MAAAPPSVDFAIKLADEGVPLRAIARATGTPSDLLLARLKAAHDDGRLLQLPKDDWPPGFPRDQRALQLARLVDENRHALTQTMQQIFSLTPTETWLLMALVQKNLPKERYDMAAKTMDVHICRMRKSLRPFNIEIDTMWGYGYQLSPDAKRRVMDLILAKALAPTG